MSLKTVPSEMCLIGSYIHDGCIGVLREVNSETDFVAGSERFKELVADLAMQVLPPSDFHSIA
jgi:translation elongation factor EF-Ts